MPDRFLAENSNMATISWLQEFSEKLLLYIFFRNYAPILPKIFDNSLGLSIHFSQLCDAVFVRVNQERIIDFIGICYKEPNTKMFLVIQVWTVRVEYLAKTKSTEL